MPRTDYFNSLKFFNLLTTSQLRHFENRIVRVANAKVTYQWYKITRNVHCFKRKLLIIFITATNQSDIRCYKCKEYETKDCSDPVNVAKLETVVCRELSYNGRAVEYESVLDKTIRQLTSPTESNETRYSCLKASIRNETGITTYSHFVFTVLCFKFITNVLKFQR